MAVPGLVILLLINLVIAVLSTTPTVPMFSLLVAQLRGIEGDLLVSGMRSRDPGSGWVLGMGMLVPGLAVALVRGLRVRSRCAGIIWLENAGGLIVDSGEFTLFSAAFNQLKLMLHNLSNSHDVDRALCRFWLRGSCAKGDQCE